MDRNARVTLPAVTLLITHGNPCGTGRNAYGAIQPISQTRRIGQRVKQAPTQPCTPHSPSPQDTPQERPSATHGARIDGGGGSDDGQGHHPTDGTLGIPETPAVLRNTSPADAPLCLIREAQGPGYRPRSIPPPTRIAGGQGSMPSAPPAFIGGRFPQPPHGRSSLGRMAGVISLPPHGPLTARPLFSSCGRETPPHGLGLWPMAAPHIPIPGAR